MTNDEKRQAETLSTMMVTLADNIDKWTAQKDQFEAQIRQADEQLDDARRKFEALLFGDDKD